MQTKMKRYMEDAYARHNYPDEMMFDELAQKEARINFWEKHH